MNQKQFIESKLSEFDGLGVNLILNKKDPIYGPENERTLNQIKIFLSTALKEIVEKHFKEIMVDKLEHTEECKKAICCHCSATPYNYAIDQITSRHKEFIK